jgi:hypothetical protein
VEIYFLPIVWRCALDLILDQAQALVTVEDVIVLIEGISHKINGSWESLGLGSRLVCLIYNQMYVFLLFAEKSSDMNV